MATNCRPDGTPCKQPIKYLLHGGVDERVVAHVHEVAEEAAEDVLGDGADGDGDGVEVARLGHPLHAHLDLEDNI